MGQFKSLEEVKEYLTIRLKIETASVEEYENKDEILWASAFGCKLLIQQMLDRLMEVSE